MKAYTKLTIVIHCQIVDKKFVAPSSGGAAIDLWKRSGIKINKTFSMMLVRPLPLPRREVRTGINEGLFHI